MYADENDVAVHLREANTLSSTVYRRSGRDSFFLFFTDDVVALRPVYGAFNLVAGLGEVDAVVRQIYAPYITRMRELGAMDFDDLLLRFRDLLAEYPEAAEMVV